MLSRPVLALAAWTLLVWTSRIRNIWADDDLSAAGQIGRTALALGFTAFAVATVVAVVRRSKSLAPLVRAFAVWTTLVWLIRGTQILVSGEWGAGFKVVHTVLAVVSVALAWWADASARSTAAAGLSHVS